MHAESISLPLAQLPLPSEDPLDVAIGDASAGGTSALMPRLNELAADFSMTSRQLSRVLRLLEDSPQGLVFGVPAGEPGPGEAGFAAGRR